MADQGKGEVKIPISLPGAAQAAADAGKVAEGLNKVETATEAVAQASAEATDAAKETTQAVKQEATANTTAAATEEKVVVAKEKKTKAAKEAKAATAAETEAERAGTDQAKKLEQSTRAATAAKKAQGDTAKDTGSKILSLGETTEKGIGLGRLFSEVTKGNFLALLNLTSILKVTGAALKTNIIGMVALAVTALGSFVAGLISSRKSLEEAGAAAETAGRQVDLFANVATRFERLKRELDAVRKQFDAITEQTRAMRSAMDALDDAKVGLEIAQLDRSEAEALARRGITPDERRAVTQDFDLRRAAVRQAAAHSRARDEAQRVAADLETNAAGQKQAVEQQASLALAETQVKNLVQSQAENLANVQQYIVTLQKGMLERQAYERDSKIPYAGSAAKGGGLRRRPDAPLEIDPENLKRAREEEAALIQQVEGGRAVLKNIQEERKTIAERSAQFGREAEVLQVRQKTTTTQAETIRQRGEADLVAARNARQEANRAAIEQGMAEWRAQGFPLAPAPKTPVAPISPTLQALGMGGGAPGETPKQPRPTYQVRDAASLREQANGLALRGPTSEELRALESQVNTLSRNMLNSPGKDYDRIAALLLSLTDAVVMRDLQEKAKREKLEAQVQRHEAQLRAGAGNR